MIEQFINFVIRPPRANTTWPVPMGKRIFSCRKNISKTGFGGNGCRADANEAAVILLPSNITVFTLDFSRSGLSEMVDDIIRSQAEKLQPANELTRTRLKEMELPDSILSLEGNLTLPAHLREEEQIGCNWFWSIG
ncbi:hypothetical protein K1719_004253 [Acacia pycnantha]|nr:hypothetical protein K1719_004253 [Acacia pycnantha]